MGRVSHRDREGAGGMSIEVVTGGEVLAAVATVDVDQLPALRTAAQQGVSLAEQASRIVVNDAISAETATALLGQVVAARRHAEQQRLSLTRPLNEVVKRINAAASRTVRPLTELEAGLKRKLLVYQAAQQRKAEQERARLEAEAERRRAEEAEERRQIEEATRVEREAAARAAAAAETAARHARDEEVRREREEAAAVEQEKRDAIAAAIARRETAR
jgi:hypothetical protein